MPTTVRFTLLLPLVLVAGALHAQPVAEVARQGLRISTSEGSAVNPCIISLDWSKAQPNITHAVIIFHGKGRNVEGSYRALLEAAKIAGSAGRNSAFIAPQFLDEEDFVAHEVPTEVLRWRHTDWESGAPALAPIPLSTFDVIDTLLTRLADRSYFPNLKSVVLAGHSGGGQLVQRYAVIGRALPAVSEAFHLRFVIANPSSYLYFGDERPTRSGAFGPFQSEACPTFNRWKYGLIDPPPYVHLDTDNGRAQLEARYAQRDVIYLLGTADTDPHGQDLDVTCSGEAQGPTRLARGQAYYAYLHSRNLSGWNQHMWLVSGVTHSAHKMFTSTCGVSALFDAGHRCER